MHAEPRKEIFVKRSWPKVTALLLVAVMLSGCIGTAKDEKKIHRVLSQFEAAMLAMDARKLADLCSYPLNVDGGEIPTKEEAAELFDWLFFEVVEEYHEFSINQRDITVGVNEATAAATVSFDFTLIDDEKVTYDEPAFFRFLKVGGSWKIAAISM